jgi:hypothetical protein
MFGTPQAFANKFYEMQYWDLGRRWLFAPKGDATFRQTRHPNNQPIVSPGMARARCLFQDGTQINPAGS